MVPHTTDGRVLFAVPWHDVVVVGTTDTHLTSGNDPVATEEEIDFILEMLDTIWRRSLPKRIFSAPSLITPISSWWRRGSTKEVSRHHKVLVSPTVLFCARWQMDHLQKNG